MILVTGATGFLGSHLLINLLDQNKSESIRGLFRSQNSINKTKQFFEFHGKSHDYQRIDWVLADILDIPALTIAFKNIEYVYHCAALISFDPSDEEKLRKINIEGTANIVNLSLDFNVKKLLYVSSIAALGDLLAHENIVTETTEWNPEIPHSDYAISKFGGEIEVWRAQQEGLDVLVINPGVILGAAINNEDWNRGSATIFATIAKSNRFYTNGTTGFIEVSDVLSIMIQLMQSDIKNEKFILVAENITYRKFADLICEGIKQKPSSIYARKWITQIAWRVDWIAANVFKRNRILSKSLAQSLHSDDVYDNSKIKKTLNFEFKSIESCVVEIGDAYLRQQKTY
jgi:nucleoside-diphosphate-sugar epimerase